MRILIFALILMSAFASQAQTLTPLAFFSRCYAHLTGHPLPLNHTLRPALIAGTLTGQQACANLIDSATISATTHEVSNAEGLLVLNRLYEFHRSWVTNGVFEQMEAYLPTPGTYNILDSTETALAITYNALYSGARYENVLKGDKGYVALRTPDPAITARYYSTAHSMPIRRIKSGQEASAPYVPFKIPGTWSGTDYATSEIQLFPAIQIGSLTGIKLQDQSATVSNYWPGFSRFAGNPSKTETATGTTGMAVNFDFFKNQGGGVLGLNTNILINYGHPIGQLSDGSLKLPRRWIKETLQTLLCTELPA